VAYVAAFLLTALFYYEFLGAAPTPSEQPDEVAWWRPAGWASVSESPLVEPLQELVEATVDARSEGTTDRSGLVPVALFAVVPIVFIVLGFFLFRSPWARAPVLALGLTLCAFSYYGWLAPGLWGLFSWRWPACLFLTASFSALFVLAPMLAKDLHERPGWLIALIQLLLFVPIYATSTEVTGTNPALYLNTSPWPVIALFGFLLVGLVLAVIHLSVGLGLFVRQALPGRRGLLAGVGMAALLAVLLGEIPFEARNLGNGLVLAAPAGIIALLAGRLEMSERVPTAVAFLRAGLVLLACITISQCQAEAFQARARNEIASTVIDALDRYQLDHDCFPDELADLVPDYLTEIPRPQIGWLRDDDETFTYIDLGSSYMLEFSSVLWVQCAYNPPYLGLFEDDDACEPFESDRSTEGAWTCETKPPVLW
jgi:hypothetical protein